MIKKDFHYVLRRVLVYFAILFVFSFINSCDVKAYDSSYYKQLSNYGLTTISVNDSYTYQTSNGFYNITYKSDGIYINDDNVYNSSDYLQYRFILISNGVNDYIFILKYAYACSSSLSIGNNVNFNNYPAIFQYLNTMCTVNGKRLNYINGSYSSTSSISNGLLIWQTANTSLFGFNFTSYDQTNSKYFTSKKDSERDNVPSLTSTINSLGVVRNKDEQENVVVSYTFNPTFNNFDTTTYKYQYKIGNNNWLTLSSNDLSFNVNQNTTVYFRVVKLSDNSVVDSQSYTITNILKYNDNVNDNYNIKYSSENKSLQDESSINRTIDRVTVNFEYFPKQSNLKYQYQFVKSGDSLSTWTDMPSNDYERGYTVTDNGTMYNRILDSDDTVLFSSTFTVNSIGKLMFDSDTTWYNSLFNKINYGSGIGTIFYLPLKIVQTVHDSYSDRCDSVNLGSLLGTSLIIPCVDIESIIGSTIYNIIDIIFMGFIALAIIRFVVNVYNRIISLNFEGNEDGGGTLFL